MVTGAFQGIDLDLGTPWPTNHLHRAPGERLAEPAADARPLVGFTLLGWTDRLLCLEGVCQRGRMAVHPTMGGRHRLLRRGRGVCP